VSRWDALAIAVLVAIICARGLSDPFGNLLGSAWLDGFGTQWFYWWMEEVVAGRSALERTDLLFFPWGKDVYLHTGGNLLDALLAAPLRLALGPIAGTNLFVVLALVGNAIGAWRLADAAQADPWGKRAAVLVALLSSQLLLEIDAGRTTQALLLPCFLWIECLMRPPTARRGLLGGVALGVSALVYWYYGLVGAVIGAVVLPARLALAAVGTRGAEAMRGLLAVGGAALVALPAAWPMLSHLQAGEVPGLLALGDSTGPLGRLQLLTEQGDSQGLSILTLTGRAAGLSELDGLQVSTGARLFTEAHLLALGLAVALRRQQAWVLLLVVAVAVGIAFGPGLVVCEQVVPNPPYLAAVERIDLLRRWWWPQRAAVFALIGCCGLAGVAVAGLPTRLRGSATLVLLMLLAWRPVSASLLPLPAWSAAVSPGFRCLAEAPAGAVVELPYALDQKNLYHQTVHGKPQLGGMLVTKDAFVPAGTRALLRDNTFLRGLVEITAVERVREPDVEPGDREALVALGFRYVAVRTEAFWRLRAQQDGVLVRRSDWQRGRRLLLPMLGEPAFEDEELAIWTLDGSSLECTDAR
jgi:hypothetical protein